MSNITDEIIKALQYPQDWECEAYTVRHIPTGLALWTSNTPFDCDVYSNRSRVPGRIPFWRRWGLKRAVRRMEDAKAVMALRKAREESK